MSAGKAAGHTSIVRRDSNPFGRPSMIGRSAGTQHSGRSAARVALEGQEQFSQTLPSCDDPIYLEGSFGEAKETNARMLHAKTSFEGSAFPQASQKLAIMLAGRGTGIDGDSMRVYKDATLQEMSAALERQTNGMTGRNQFETPVEGFSIVRSDLSVPLVRKASKAAVCITIQGTEWSMVGERRYECRAGQAFILSVEQPGHCAVPVATRAGPYLGLVIELDRAYTHQIFEELGIHRYRVRSNKPCVGSAFDVSPQLLNCALRAVRLLDTPEAIPMLYPGVMRELCYWLLTSPASDEVVDLAMDSFHDGRILHAIQLLRGKFSRPIKVEQLAMAAGMSPATFHRQFKSATSMSPMQYLKQLRLLAARRLMITSDSNVENVANEVGYLSASQFSREYARMFGKPPRRDISSCRSSELSSPNIA